MIPIPKKLLQHTVTVQVPKEDALMGGEYEAPVTLSGVYIEPVDKIRQTSYQLQDSTNALMFVDARNTKGAFAIPAGSLVILPGTTSPSSVNACREFSAFGKVHHWEVEIA